VSAERPARENTGIPRAAPRLREVRLEGELAFEPEALKHAIPGIWTRQRYDARAIEADLTWLRSFYFSHGYFDARVGVGGVTVDGGDAIVTLEVQSGPKYAVRFLEIDGITAERNTRTNSSGEFPVDTFCTCLLDARRTAESQG